MGEFLERRGAERYAITLSARVRGAGRCFRAQILDVSAGGLLLQAPEGLSVGVDATLEIEAIVIGRVAARVVGLSSRGIHLRIEADAARYGSALRQLSDLSRTW